MKHQNKTLETLKTKGDSLHVKKNNMADIFTL
jgi:hypothetical protein